MREARRQKGLSAAVVPEICVLDPDGDILRRLRAKDCADQHPGWTCYHTELYVFHHDGREYGIVGCAIGTAFAVLIAEEPFAADCRFLISVTSAGQILRVQAPPYFIIDRALRDEGASYHYRPPSDYSEADPLIHLEQISLRVVPWEHDPLAALAEPIPRGNRLEAHRRACAAREDGRQKDEGMG